jgi:hypothetical protein
MVAILQPFIPDYREEFFNGLGQMTDLDIYCYSDPNNIQKHHFKKAHITFKSIRSWEIGPFLLYNPFAFLNPKYDVIILMLSFTHISTWLLLVTRPLHRKKIILWGHGISCKRFMKEAQKPNGLLKYMIALANEVWFYTGHEQNIWRRIFPHKHTVSLNNTISASWERPNTSKSDKKDIKRKYAIGEEIILIFCARFNMAERRADILEKVISNVNADKYGFIIIGDGPFKPDFTRYKNVHDFGSVYERHIKNELFQIADIYFQPAWLGLSVSEAMAYHKPIYTFERTEKLLQCVEYSYLLDGFNSVIAKDIPQFIRLLNNTTQEYINLMSANCKIYYEKNLTMENMVTRAHNGILLLK